MYGHTLPAIVQRHFVPMMAMLRDVITSCPDDVLMAPTLGVREHIYHALVGMDVWLSPNPAAYAFGDIVDDDAAQLKAAASDRITRDFLIGFLDLLETKVAALPDDAVGYLEVVTLRGREFTLLDRCLGQVRHVQHHIGVANEKLRVRGARAADWRGYGEG